MGGKALATVFAVIGAVTGLIGWLLIGYAEGSFQQGIAVLIAIQFWLISAVWFVGAGIVYKVGTVEDRLEERPAQPAPGRMVEE